MRLLEDIFDRCELTAVTPNVSGVRLSDEEGHKHSVKNALMSMTRRKAQIADDGEHKCPATGPESTSGGTDAAMSNSARSCRHVTCYDRESKMKQKPKWKCGKSGKGERGNEGHLDPNDLNPTTQRQGKWCIHQWDTSQIGASQRGGGALTERGRMRILTTGDADSRRTEQIARRDGRRIEDACCVEQSRTGRYKQVWDSSTHGMAAMRRKQRENGELAAGIVAAMMTRDKIHRINSDSTVWFGPESNGQTPQKLNRGEKAIDCGCAPRAPEPFIGNKSLEHGVRNNSQHPLAEEFLRSSA
ncbi:hypothetical protein C8R45DRAFT_1181244 [Mycena sanguinolenta]|nr:hypothetical protein C8R45DRAFT_1181244 [Mycena sanguinolenta]